MSREAITKKKLSLNSNFFEDFKKTPQKLIDSHFSLPQSPKFPLQMLTDLQDQIRQKEIDLVESNKHKKRLEQENSELKDQIQEKDKELTRVHEENTKLKYQLFGSGFSLKDS